MSSAEFTYMKTRAFLISLVLIAALLPIGSVSSTHKAKWCSRAHARQLIVDFIDAYNEGQFRRLDRFFAEQPEFAWYRLFPERDQPFAEDRSTLIPYFRERHELGDRFELVTLRLNRERGSVPHNAWGFGFEVRRTSSDTLPWGDATFRGKGGADCRILSWNGGWP
jgi:hypothetical protein